MKNINRLTNNNFNDIISLNNNLKDIERLEDILKHLSSFLEKEFKIIYFNLKLDETIIYKNYKDDNTFKVISFSTKLNSKKNLDITILCIEENLEFLNNHIEEIKSIFNIISLTIYNKYLEEELEHMEFKDSLTGVYNRQFVDEYLKKALPLSNREDKKIAFLKVGIDHFKAVIDEFTYEIGDKVLKTLVNTLKHTIRDTDIIARVESDEFIIVLHHIINEENAILIADKIINNFQKEKIIVDKETKQILKKTICTGILIYPDDEKKVDEIFRSTDIALYEAKNKGRGQSFKFQKDANVIELF